MSNKQLAQSRPANTSAASILNEAAPWRVDSIVLCNTSSSTAKYSIFHDADGTTYDGTTALAYEIPLLAGETHLLEFSTGIWNQDRLGNLAVQSDTADAITFSAYGEVEGERY